MNKDYKIAIIGAGAIGGITAAYIKQAGYDVEVVCKYDDITKKVNDGLKVIGIRGESVTPIKAVKTIEELSGIKDFVIVATKAYDMPEACSKALRFTSDDTLFVSMQNGICTDAMADIVGEDRTVGCVVGFGATMLSAGVLDMTSEGTFIIGMDNIEQSLKLNDLKVILESVVPTFISDNILSDLYSKLIVNSCITSLGVISGLKLGDMMKSKKIRKIFLKIMEEALEVSKKMELYVPPYAGKLDYYLLFKSDSFIARMKRHLTIRIVGIKYKNLKSSSLQSLKRGRPTEIDYFNGYICKKGKEVGIKTPINRIVTDMIKDVEKGKREISVKNFEDKSFKKFKV